MILNCTISNFGETLSHLTIYQKDSFYIGNNNNNNNNNNNTYIYIYGLDGPGSNPGRDEIFRQSRLALGPTQPPVKWVPGLSWG